MANMFTSVLCAHSLLSALEFEDRFALAGLLILVGLIIRSLISLVIITGRGTRRA